MANDDSGGSRVAFGEGHGRRNGDRRETWRACRIQSRGLGADSQRYWDTLHFLTRLLYLDMGLAMDADFEGSRHRLKADELEALVTYIRWLRDERPAK